ncbi:MAG: hypothetical protein LUQ50_01880, partial [Methanospirillum sp.]|nr:hypothetical protein [Methanospirillum sp.]
RGGDHDMVEYDFISFHPGDNLNTMGYEGDYTLTISKDPVSVRLPGRIHLTVLDMNRFSPGHPGGGGIGFAIQVYTKVTVQCSESGYSISYSRPAIIEHFLKLFSHVVGYIGGFAIQAFDPPYKHVGLGSTCTVLMGLAVAVNQAVGNPLSRDQLRTLIGKNYVEEIGDDLIAYAFETGVGPAVSSDGGMVVMGDNLTGSSLFHVGRLNFNCTYRRATNLTSAIM